MMKRVLTLVIALLFLAACAAPVGEELPTYVDETTEEATTTQPARVTEPFVIAVEVDEADPFSFVLRAYAEFIQDFRENFESAFLRAAENPLQQHFVMQPQWGFEEINAISIGWSGMRMPIEYALYDISGNGVDDLLIRFAGGFPVLFDMYSIVDGVAVQQLQKGVSNNTHMRVHPGGAIQYGGRMGSYWTDLYHFVDGQLRFAVGFRSRDSWDEDMNHYVRQYITHESRDNWETVMYIAVSEEEAERIWARYDTDPRGDIVLDWRPLFVPA
ncbi:MAG: hypothetical protein FWD06_00855 [Oscillospiraceae bacterium]|nr:hypothetical protein [Oscillospiraceae bacterium]